MVSNTVSIQIVDNKFLVDNFESEDPEIVSYFEEVAPEKREKRFELSLKVGSVALKTIGTTERIDYIEKEFYKLKESYNQSLEDTLNNLENKIKESFGEDGALSKIFLEYFGDEGTLPKKMNELLGDDGKLSDILNEHFGENGKLLNDVFDPTKEGTSLFQLRSLLMDEISKLRKDLGISKSVEEITDRTTLKGIGFEDFCEAYLETIISTRMGYAVKRTSTETGFITGSKKGDFVITISEIPETRIVLETKDYDTISLPRIREELEGAMENRDAKYGIFVSKWEEALPKSVGCFNEYDGKHLVCALASKNHDGEPHPEFLHTALCWARNKLLVESVESRHIDVSFMREKMEEIGRKIDRFAQLRTECTNAETAVERIRNYVSEIKDGIESELQEMDNEIIRILAS